MTSNILELYTLAAQCFFYVTLETFYHRLRKSNEKQPIRCRMIACDEYGLFCQNPYKLIIWCSRSLVKEEKGRIKKPFIYMSLRKIEQLDSLILASLYNRDFEYYFRLGEEIPFYRLIANGPQYRTPLFLRPLALVWDWAMYWEWYWLTTTPTGSWEWHKML